MRVLIGCEYSAIVRDAFRAAGHDAWSCDLLPTDGNPQWHYQGCIIDAIKQHGPWDFIGLHPSCTAMAVSGNRHYGVGKPKHHLRVEAIEWTAALWDVAIAHAKHVYLENPVSVLSQWKKPTQTIQPWQFGHGETKATCLWLHNLPPLMPTNIVTGREQRIWKLPPIADRWKIRSKTLDSKRNGRPMGKNPA